MHRASTVRATGLAVTLLATVGLGVASASPADGTRNTQDYAYATFATELDDCRRVEAAVSFVAGDRLKEPLGGGAPGPWSDVTVQVWVRDECTGKTAELMAWVGTPPDITRLRSASADGFAMTISDVTGELSLEVSGSIAWTVAGRAVTIIETDPATRHFRSDRRAPATVEGELVVSDADGDLLDETLLLTQSAVIDAQIGWANEIRLGG